MDLGNVHVKEPKLKLLLVIVALILLMLAVVAFLHSLKRSVSGPTFPHRETTTEIGPPIFRDSVAIEEKRTTLFALVDQSKERSLTPGEKAQILKEFGGEQTAQYKFSAEEKEELLRALNKY